MITINQLNPEDIDLANYEQFTINEEQAQQLDFFHLPRPLAAAIDWLEERNNHLHEEYTENKMDGWGYGSSFGCCRATYTETVAIYETTSGTLLSIDADGEIGVALPRRRLGGNHHRQIWLALGGTMEAFDKAYPEIECETVFYMSVQGNGDPCFTLNGIIHFSDLQSAPQSERYWDDTDLVRLSKGATVYTMQIALCFPDPRVGKIVFLQQVYNYKSGFFDDELDLYESANFAWLCS